MVLPLFSKRQIELAYGRRGRCHSSHHQDNTSNNITKHTVSGHRTKNNTCNDDTMHPNTAYCPHNVSIDATLRQLHTDLRNGVAGTQQEIDRYLFAANPAFALCQTQLFPLAALVLPTHATLRFELLPNIQQMIASVLSVQNTDTSIASQFLRQCIPLKRRTKRAQRDIVWQDDDCRDMRIFIRCAYGMLLGLYPMCSKFTHFHNRVALNGLLHAVLVAPVADITRFCNTFSYILRLACMEHCCYVMDRYSPSLALALNKKKQFASFTSTIYSVGDTFRAELNKENLAIGNLQQTWVQLKVLEDTAQTLFDRCSRAFRTVISPPPLTVLTSQSRRNIAVMCKQNPSIIASIMQAHVCPNKYIFGIINEPLVPQQHTEDIWQLLNNVRVEDLTAQIAMQQLAKCYEMYPKDLSLRRRQGMLQVCIVCALKNSYYNNPCATRFDAATRRLTCVECHYESIMQINLIGRVLYIGNHAIVFSTCCMTPIIWAGTGFEWGCKCSPHCLKQAFQSQCNKRKKTPVQAAGKGNQCYVCSSRAVTNHCTVLNLHMKRNDNLHFCNKHSPPIPFLKQCKV